MSAIAVGFHGQPVTRHPSRYIIWASTPAARGAGMGAYTLPVLGSVAGTEPRALHTRTGIRGATQDTEEEATQRNLGAEEMRAWELESTSTWGKEAHRCYWEPLDKPGRLIITFLSIQML